MTEPLAGHLDRRQFLLLCSMSLLAAPFLGVRALAGPDERADESAGSRLFSVGYWPGSARLPDLGTVHLTAEGRISHTVQSQGPLPAVPSPLPTALVDAARLRAGDPQFARTGAVLTVHGLLHHLEHGRLVAEPQLLQLSLDVLFDVDTAGRMETVPCAAWRYAGGPPRHCSPPVRLRIPVDAGSGLRLSLTKHETGPGSRERIYDPLASGRSAAAVAVARVLREDIRFTVGAEPGRPRLRRGLYLVAALPGTRRRAPLWSQFHLVDDGKTDPHASWRLARPGLAGGDSPRFSCLVVSVDHAGPLPRPQV